MTPGGWGKGNQTDIEPFLAGPLVPHVLPYVFISSNPFSRYSPLLSYLPADTPGIRGNGLRRTTAWHSLILQLSLSVAGPCPVGPMDVWHQLISVG